MTPYSRAKFAVLLILDGFGIAPPGPGNAISQASLPNIKQFTFGYPHCQLAASGEAVGLPKGEMGNTETGHLNLGAGRIVYQDLPRINMAIADGGFFRNQTFLQAFDHVRRHNSRLHLLGLIGAGGVHANQEHMYALLQLAAQQNFSDVYLHLITDGRDSPPTSALTYLRLVEDETQKFGVGRIATIAGRYWMMDRDARWERTAKAYWALVKGEGRTYHSPEEAIQEAYHRGQTDEFIDPSIMVDDNGNMTPRIGASDAVIFYNFRVDRPRELTKAFVLDDFETEANLTNSFDPYAIRHSTSHLSSPEAASRAEPFQRGVKIPDLFFVTMTQYGTSIPTEVAFPPEIVREPLGQVVSERGFQQLRVAESEKERFVTFYFNGQRENPFPGEDRLIIPSPKVPTYDLKPEMSAYPLTEQVLLQLQQEYKLVVINLANVDMVGHTGNIPAAIQACEVVDSCVGKIANAVQERGGVTFITADHGNTEEMINPRTGEVDTEHSTYPVPFLMVGSDKRAAVLSAGVLGDVAPTVLAVLGIPVPSQMTGKNLLG
jgi:2,3-bisphosphoglycerate-independent phosphoglycerate mutase